jgi:WD40 repeat protein
MTIARQFTDVVVAIGYLIVLWEVQGDCKNTTTLKGHTGVVLDLQWNRDGQYVCTTLLID